MQIKTTTKRRILCLFTVCLLCVSMFLNPLTVHAEVNDEVRGTFTQQTAEKYSPNMYAISKEDDGTGYYYAVGSNQMAYCTHGVSSALNVGTNFIFYKNPFYDSFYWFKEELYSFDNNNLIITSGAVEMDLLSENICNVFLVNDYTNTAVGSWTSLQAVTLLNEFNLVSNYDNLSYFDITDLYESDLKTGMKNTKADLISHTVNDESTTITLNEDVALYIDFLVSRDYDYGNPVFGRQFIYDMPAGDYDWDTLESYLTFSTQLDGEDNICIIGVGAFTHDGTGTYKDSPYDEGINVISWSYNVYKYAEYNTEDAFIYDPCNNNSNYTGSNSYDPDTTTGDIEDNVENEKDEQGIIDIDDAIADITQLILGLLGFSVAFPSMLGVVFSFLPVGVITLMSLTFYVALIVAIIKLLRG